MDLKHSFSDNPVSVNIPRSRFDMNHRVKTTFNAGDLVPVDWMEILPGDTIEMDLSSLVRMLAAPLVPTMDSATLSLYAFFVPNRILWSHWEELQGANKTDAWTPESEYVLPSLNVLSSTSQASIAAAVSARVNAVVPGSALDYLGIPATDVGGSDYATTGVSILPLCAYGKIWSDWFRGESLQDPLPWLTTLYNASSGASYNAASIVGYDGTGGKSLYYTCLPANKFHDVFTSALPSPQRGAAVSLGLAGLAPIIADGTTLHDMGDNLIVGSSDENVLSSAYLGTSSSGAVGGYGSVTDSLTGVYASNAYADLSEASAATINDLRYAFALQRILEKDARAGNGRYVELLYSFFGVRNGDARMARPEFLGGSNTTIGIQQVENNSNTGTGSLGAYSLTVGKNLHFIKSFTEHGILMVVGCVRKKSSYGQGISRYWGKSRRYDFYIPPFAHLGEQGINSYEIYAKDRAINLRNESIVFGFNEAWYEDRYQPDRVSGLLRPGATYDTAGYTYVDDYDTAPTLSASWLTEDSINIGKTQGLGSTLDQPGNPIQFVGDFYFGCKATRAMPVFSVPGLIDHY